MLPYNISPLLGVVPFVGRVGGRAIRSRFVRSDGEVDIACSRIEDTVIHCMEYLLGTYMTLRVVWSL